MRPILLLPLLVVACSRAPAPPPAPHQIVIAGASAGLPFAENAAERFTLADANAVAPLAVAGGSALGIARLCGDGGVRPDLVIATRAPTDAERRRCAAAGIDGLAEIRFGWTALVLVGRIADGPSALAKAQAVAAIAGPARAWNAIDPRLPAAPIRVYGLARDVVAGDGSPWPPAIRDDTRATDAPYVPRGSDADGATGAMLRAPGSNALVPFPFAARQGLRAIPIGGVPPTPATIASGRYPGRAPLILIVPEDGRRREGLPAILRLFAASIDPGGPFARAGLVPLDAAGRAAAKRALASTAGAA